MWANAEIVDNPSEQSDLEEINAIDDWILTQVYQGENYDNFRTS